MNSKYVVLDKKVGETPLSLLEKFKSENPELSDEKLAYAGRLDPMASGKLLMLIGDECKRQDNYLGLDKEYEFEVLLGFSSDSNDVLGIAEYSNRINNEIPEKQFEEIAGKFTGELSMPFPNFSSKTVNGKPLFLWTLEDRLEEIEIPLKNSCVYNLSFLGTRQISKKELQATIFEKINSIPEVKEPSKALGENFRRDEIRRKWDGIFENIEENEFQLAKFRCIASSGTYMRSLASEIGMALGTTGLAPTPIPTKNDYGVSSKNKKDVTMSDRQKHGGIGVSPQGGRGLAYSIHRTKIGKYKKISKHFGLWYKKFA